MQQFRLVFAMYALVALTACGAARSSYPHTASYDVVEKSLATLSDDLAAAPRPERERQRIDNE